MKILPFFEFVIVKNKGIVFGLFSNIRINPYVLMVFSILSIFLIMYLFVLLFNYRYSLILAVIIGGAIGNIIDRFIYGYVVDFIKIDSFYVFNIADSCITIGGIILLIVLLFGKANDKYQI
jgi:signal peptidase II